MESKGSFQYCRDVIQKMRAEVEQLIDDVNAQIEDTTIGNAGSEAVRKFLSKLVIR
ncbi:hypothetical protein BDU57DRAFT_509931 [Ampelomyces quisqualis]|uniref:Uncharacterized protein n=1 Tax=Ampelomyces quisqualis TaxID=50730 RepID=A0A6A5R0N7_AMPQU|nr:hypothetical protein BDU57DRAFT_509931 [Ampelomyces quisqualis]